MFEDEEFVVDEESAEYRMLHPNVRGGGAGASGQREQEAKDRALISQHFEPVSAVFVCVGKERRARGVGGGSEEEDGVGREAWNALMSLFSHTC